MLNTKKAIFQMVVLVLLLLGAIVVYVYLDLWLDDVINQKEIDQELGKIDVEILGVETDSIRIENNYPSSLSYTSVRVENNTCALSGSIPGNSFIILNISSCLGGIGASVNDVSLITDSGTFSNYIFTDGEYAPVQQTNDTSPPSSPFDVNTLCSNAVLLFNFNETSQPFIQDNFNDNTINTSMWIESDTNGLLGETNGRLHFNATGTSGDRTAALYSISNYDVNFDAYADFIIHGQEAPAASHHLMLIGENAIDDTDEFYIGKRRRTASRQSRALGEGLSNLETHNFADDFGYYRILRTSSSNTYGFELGERDTAWNWAGDRTGYSHTDTMTGNRNFTLYFKKESNALWNVSFDNFVMWDDNTLFTDFSPKNNPGVSHSWTNPNGKFGDAARFDGIGTKIEVNDSSEFNTDTGSVSFWFNSNSTQYNTNASFFSKDSSGYDSGGLFEVRMLNSSLSPPRLSFEFKDDVGESSLTSNFSHGQWEHVTITWDLTNVRLYVNGVEANSTASNWNTTPNTEGFLIGADQSFASDNSFYPIEGYYNGSIDEFAVFNKTLNATEISSLYSATSQLNCTGY